MNLRQKALYHQIHPAKLLTDIAAAAAVALYCLWQHSLVAELVVALVPSIVVSFVITQRVELERYRRSFFGKYANKYLANLPQSLRIVGFVVMAIGA